MFILHWMRMILVHGWTIAELTDLSCVPSSSTCTFLGVFTHRSRNWEENTQNKKLIWRKKRDWNLVCRGSEPQCQFWVDKQALGHRYISSAATWWYLTRSPLRQILQAVSRKRINGVHHYRKHTLKKHGKVPYRLCTARYRKKSSWTYLEKAWLLCDRHVKWCLFKTQRTANSRRGLERSGSGRFFWNLVET